jgi:hypothetical protein
LASTVVRFECVLQALHGSSIIPLRRDADEQWKTIREEAHADEQNNV